MNKIEASVASNQLELYSLNNPGISLLAQEERLSLTTLAQERLPGKLKKIDPDRFSKLPISNLVFHQADSGEWENGSWILDINGFDQSLFDWLEKPQSASLRLLDADDDLAELSGSQKMAEIGFNVGGGEIVIKRILLPNAYADMVTDWSPEPYLFAGTKMPEVFVDAWLLLAVGEVDREWDNRVREQLEGNNRNMNKRINYKMINGEKWVEWNGEMMWAGLLSDKRDIDRFLAEETALGSLKPGEFLAAKYSHSGVDGAISAATVGEQEEQILVVGDVQMMGPNGEILQGAVEGPADKIDRLTEQLINKMRQELGLGSQQEGFNISPLFDRLPEVPLASYPMREWLVPETRGEAPSRSLLEGDKAEGFEAPNTTTIIFASETGTRFTSETDTFTDSVTQYHGDTFAAEEEAEQWFASDVTPQDFSEPDYSDTDPISFDEDEPDQPREPKPGGGGGLVRPQPTRTDLEGEVTLQHLRGKQEQIDTPVLAEQAVEQPTGLDLEGQSDAVPQEKSTSSTEPEVAEKHEQSELPWWVASLEGIDDYVVPEWKWTQPEMIKLNHSLIAPGLQTEKNLSEAAEMAFEQGKWPEFDYLNYIINQVEEIVFISLFNLMNTTLTQAEPDLALLQLELNDHRGSGLSRKAVWPKPTEVAGALI
jgi:hypothetical protein